MAEFKDWLKDRARTLGFTQQELAKQVGVSQTTVSQWMSGLDNPRPEALVKLAEVIDEDWIYLFHLAYHAALPSDTKGEDDPRKKRVKRKIDNLSESELDRLEAYLTHVVGVGVQKE